MATLPIPYLYAIAALPTLNTGNPIRSLKTYGETYLDVSVEYSSTKCDDLFVVEVIFTSKKTGEKKKLSEGRESQRRLAMEQAALGALRLLSENTDLLLKFISK